jgi:hypothetical protein
MIVCMHAAVFFAKSDILEQVYPSMQQAPFEQDKRAIQSPMHHIPAPNDNGTAPSAFSLAPLPSHPNSSMMTCVEFDSDDSLDDEDDDGDDDDEDDDENNPEASSF